MGKLMKERKISPDVILSSPAKRAAHTAQIVKEKGKLSAEIRYDERIYEASPLTLLSILAQLDDNIQKPLLIGHNPGFESLLKFLTDDVEAMPTAALAKIKLKIEHWQEITQGCGKLEFLIKPKEEQK